MKVDGQRQIEVISKLTHRKIGKILSSVQDKLKNYLAKEKGWTDEQLTAAFNDSKVRETVQRHMAQENI